MYMPFSVTCGWLQLLSAWQTLLSFGGGPRERSLLTNYLAFAVVENAVFEDH